MSSEKPLRGRVAIVTGAGRGVGRAIALELARAGAVVSLAARTGPELVAVGDEISALGGASSAFAADVSEEAQMVALVGRTVERWGRLDVVVNNAGIGIFGPLEHYATEDWDRVMAVNARGPFIVCREAIPHLRRHPPSYIVNISSVVGIKGYANQAAYSASKHALMGMTKALARELQADGVRVHAICPGGIDTTMAGDARPDLDRSVLMQPQEIAETVLFLVTRRGNAVIDGIQLRRAASTPWA
jgi:3-oxoacyl-[acyl-carrier protein] reductase